jgi:hypothetical protein
MDSCGGSAQLRDQAGSASGKPRLLDTHEDMLR